MSEVTFSIGPPALCPGSAVGSSRTKQPVRNCHLLVALDSWDRVELRTLTKEFLMPRFLERDEAIRRAPRAPYAWDGVAEAPAVRRDGEEYCGRRVLSRLTLPKPRH